MDADQGREITDPALVSLSAVVSTFRQSERRAE
jgi:hypothetical protein